jgi:H+/Cl- antiporter ClcA
MLEFSTGTDIAMSTRRVVEANEWNQCGAETIPAPHLGQRASRSRGSARGAALHRHAPCRHENFPRESRRLRPTRTPGGRGGLGESMGPHGLLLIPLSTMFGGLLAGMLIYSFAPEAEGHGTDTAVKAFHRLGGFIREMVPFLKMVVSAITIGSGGAAGREGTPFTVSGISSTVCPGPSSSSPLWAERLLGVLALALPQVLGGGYGWIQEAIDGKLVMS